MENLSRLIEAATKLVSEFLWPGIFIFVFSRLEPNLKALVNSIGEGSVKGLGFEVSMKKVAVSEKLTLATESKTQDGGAANLGQSFREARSIAEKYITPNLLFQARRARILWVDDKPLNNAWETQALETLGIKVIPVTSTDEALKKLTEMYFNLVITDMNRPPDPEAGLTLVREMKSNSNSTPVIIYGSSKTKATKRDIALKLGAAECVSLPNELIQQVCEILAIKDTFFT